tara:strand:+ start:1496 stop:1768 length:273 start_codon:yes stop_codon:yes gene_type:complete
MVIDLKKLTITSIIGVGSILVGGYQGLEFIEKRYAKSNEIKEINQSLQKMKLSDLQVQYWKIEDEFVDSLRTPAIKDQLRRLQFEMDQLK